MNKTAKVVIVVALVIVVGVVIVLKRSASPPQGLSAREPGAPTGLPRLVDLGSTSCVPCKMMAPILEELKKEYAGRMQVVFIDVLANPDVGERYGIRLIPTQIFFDGTGKELFRHEGFFSREDILGKFKEFNITFAEAPSN